MLFKYRAVNNSGVSVRGELEASNRKEALYNLKIELDGGTIVALDIKKEIKAFKSIVNRLNNVKINIKKPRGNKNVINREYNTLQLVASDSSPDIFAKDLEKPKIKKRKSAENVRSLPVDVMKVPEKQYKKIKIGDTAVKFFLSSFAMLLSSGVSISKSLIILEGQTKSKKMIVVIRNIYESVQSGKSLSYSMAQYPRVFDRLCIGIVAIGESSGALDECMLEIASFIEKRIKNKKSIQTATIYPALTLGVMLIIAVLGTVFIVPMVAGLLEEMDLELPLITRIVFNIADKIPYVIGAGILMLIALAMLRRIPKVNDFLDIKTAKALLKIPVLKGVVLDSAMFYFSSSMGLMLKNGLRMTDSLIMVAAAMSNRVLRWEVQDSIELINDGASLSEALSEQEHFDSMICGIIKVGEESGNMEKAMNNISQHYMNELSAKIEMIMQWITPVSILVMAIVALPIVFALYSLIMELQTGAF